MGVRIKDTGYNKYKNTLQDLQRSQVAVGLFAKLGDEVLLKGLVNEFGTNTAGRSRTVKIPERSFLRSTFDKEHRRVAKRFSHVARAIKRGKAGILRELGLIGLEQKAKVQKTITELKHPALAPSTIKQKGSSSPLIDTGELRASIDYEVRTK